MHDPNGSTAISGETPSLTIVEQVAALEGTDPIALPPLNDAIDPDALDSLVQSSAPDDPRTPAAVHFTYCGYDVHVEGGGSILVSDP